jgi:hypothetical protein
MKSWNEINNELVKSDLFEQFENEYDGPYIDFHVAENGGTYDEEGNFLTWEEWDIRDREEHPEDFIEEDFEEEEERNW